MGVGVYARKAILDWGLGGASPTRPATHAVGLAVGSPSSISASECTASAYVRQVATFNSASAGGLASNVNAFTFTVSSAATLVGIHVWDTVLASGSGNMLWYGQLSASSVMVAGDTLAFAAGALTITLS